jgi:hypothetical protein
MHARTQAVPVSEAARERAEEAARVRAEEALVRAEASTGRARVLAMDVLASAQGADAGVQARIAASLAAAQTAQDQGAVVALRVAVATAHVTREAHETALAAAPGYAQVAARARIAAEAHRQHEEEAATEMMLVHVHAPCLPGYTCTPPPRTQSHARTHTHIVTHMNTRAHTHAHTQVGAADAFAIGGADAPGAFEFDGADAQVRCTTCRAPYAMTATQ